MSESSLGLNYGNNGGQGPVICNKARFSLDYEEKGKKYFITNIKEKIRLYFLLIFNILKFPNVALWIEDSSHYCRREASRRENVWIYLAMFGDLTMLQTSFYEQSILLGGLALKDMFDYYAHLRWNWGLKTDWLRSNKDIVMY